jgi:Mg/Co/Ni transporter MgtE
MNMRVQTAELLDQEQLANIDREMPMDEAVDLLAHFPRKKVNALFSLLPQDKVNQIRELLSLSERVAGSLMTVEFVAVKSDVTAGQVIERLKAESKNREIYYVYVVDESQTLIGITTLRRLLSALPEKPVTEIMRKRIAKVRVDTDVRDVVQIFFKYDFMAVPVVDKHNKMQGIIAIKDALEAVFPQMREEMEEAT